MYLCGTLKHMVIMKLDTIVRILDEVSFEQLPKEYIESHSWSTEEDPLFGLIYIIRLNEQEDHKAPAPVIDINHNAAWENLGIIPVYHFCYGSPVRVNGYYLFSNGSRYEIRDEDGKAYLVSEAREHRDMYNYMFNGKFFFNV